MSARLSRVSTSSPWSGKSAIPMLAATCRRSPATSNGVSSALTSFIAACEADSWSPTPGRMMANSSPPSRATVSEIRSSSRSLAATCLRSWSPAWWPRVSLTSLNPFRSIKRSAIRCPSRRPTRIAFESRSCSRTRFGSPVRVSWSTWCSSSCWWAFWSLMSSRVRITDAGSPRAFRTSEATDRIHTVRPSLARQRMSARMVPRSNRESSASRRSAASSSNMIVASGLPRRSWLV